MHKKTTQNFVKTAQIDSNAVITFSYLCKFFLEKNTFFRKKTDYSAISPFKVAAEALFIRTLTYSPM